MLLSVADEKAPVVHAEFCRWLPRVELVVFGGHTASIEEQQLDMRLWGRQLDADGGHCTDCNLFVESEGLRVNIRRNHLFIARKRGITPLGLFLIDNA
jgi:hypothetical protein